MDRMWSAIKGGWLATSVLGLVLLVATPAQGSTIIYSNLGPGGSFDAAVFWPIGLAGPTSELETAVSFIPSFDATLDSFRVATRFSAGTNDFSSIWPATLVASLVRPSRRLPACSSRPKRPS